MKYIEQEGHHNNYYLTLSKDNFYKNQSLRRLVEFDSQVPMGNVHVYERCVCETNALNWVTRLSPTFISFTSV